MSVSMSSGNQSASGREIVGRRDERHRVRQREGRHDEHQRAEPPERNHQADEKQQVVGPAEDVPEAELNEPQGGLVPARIEAHQAQVPGILEGAHGAARRQESQHRHRPQAEPREPRVDRKPDRSD